MGELRILKVSTTIERTLVGVICNRWQTVQKTDHSVTPSNVNILSWGDASPGLEAMAQDDVYHSRSGCGCGGGERQRADSSPTKDRWERNLP